MNKTNRIGAFLLLAALLLVTTRSAAARDIRLDGQVIFNQSFTLAEQGTTLAGNLVIREVATADGVDTIIEGFTDADDQADFSLTLRGAHNLDGSSFNL